MKQILNVVWLLISIAAFSVLAYSVKALCVCVCVKTKHIVSH